jgi:hypothetical protein
VFVSPTFEKQAISYPERGVNFRRFTVIVRRGMIISVGIYCEAVDLPNKCADEEKEFSPVGLSPSQSNQN